MQVECSSRYTETYATARDLRGACTPIVILVVDDDSAVRKLASLILKRDGFEVLNSSSGIEALALSESHPAQIDLLLTDFEMPQMNGLELRRAIARSRPRMKALLMSGAEWAAKAAEAGDVPFLVKPFKAATLLAEVNRALDRFEE